MAGEAGKLAKQADFYLEEWGAWARAGDRQAMPGVRSGLAGVVPRVRGVPVDRIGEAVDAVLCAMPDDARQVAVLIYKRRRGLAEVRAALGLSKAALDGRLLMLRGAVVGGVAVVAWQVGGVAA